MREGIVCHLDLFTVYGLWFTLVMTLHNYSTMPCWIKHGLCPVAGIMQPPAQNVIMLDQTFPAKLEHC